MSKTAAIYKRELRSYFLSPTAYVAIGIFLMILSFMFFGTLVSTGIATMDFAFQDIAAVFLLISPAITMKLLAEEKKAGTIQLLFTSPIKVSSIIMGKYLAALTVYLIALFVTLIYPAILYYYSRIDLGPVFSGYLGAILIGGAYIAIGLFASALTESQIIASIVALVMTLSLYLIQSLVSTFTGVMSKVVEFVSVVSHFDDFTRGIIDTSNLFYFLSLIFIFLFLTMRVIQRNWSRG